MTARIVLLLLTAAALLAACVAPGVQSTPGVEAPSDYQSAHDSFQLELEREASLQFGGRLEDVRLDVVKEADLTHVFIHAGDVSGLKALFGAIKYDPERYEPLGLDFEAVLGPEGQRLDL